MKDIANTSWAEERNVLIDVDDRAGSTFQVPNSPWVFSSTDTSTRGAAKFRGEDNEEVCVELLGMHAADVDRLTKEGVLSIRLPKAK